VAKQGARGPPQERPDTLFKALQKGKGNLSVIAEYRRKMRSGFIKDPLEPELLSPLYRTGGASAVVISTDKNTGGCSASDVVKVISEQKSAAGDFPGPLPCILRDLIVDEFQIANAKVGFSSHIFA
jgi:indole-3-glycerol phosphate synthase